MIYTLLVLSSPGAGHGARTAADFALTAIGRGHTINRVFFLDEGVDAGCAAVVYPQDESTPLDNWAALAEEHAVELVLCISSALKRGLLDSSEAQRYDKPAATVHPAFSIGGLGQLIEAAAGADRLMTFGG
ncbi:sulfurtransferase complex subunit TusD [Mangrovimicrobium sediminis]|uniref:Sulfurtransferase complex subunit TusD n=1 Tax=Mangrovimicrobium sediminis TaxID=2562682 RepID=A0A4Z0M213_9GAMM|nr:sulfurtransferase complex subunit TusD [Haliea sp. SAOS-164]TGD73632.1 sulfurtransferase complex subunit TusD [Haliea sp. SAOS-164]